MGAGDADPHVEPLEQRPQVLAAIAADVGQRQFGARPLRHRDRTVVADVEQEVRQPRRFLAERQPDHQQHGDRRLQPQRVPAQAGEVEHQQQRRQHRHQEAREHEVAADPDHEQQVRQHEGRDRDPRPPAEERTDRRQGIRSPDHEHQQRRECEQQRPVAPQAVGDVAPAQREVGIAAGLGEERVRHPVAVVGVAPQQVRHEHQRERQQVAEQQPRRASAPAVPGDETTGRRDEQRPVRPRHRRQHTEEPEQPRLARAAQRQHVAQHRETEQREQRGLEAGRRQRRSVMDRGVRASSDRHQDAAAGGARSHHRQQQHGAAVSDDAPGDRPVLERTVAAAQRDAERQPHRPHEVRVALDRRLVRIEVEHQALALGKVLRVTERDVGVVAGPTQVEGLPGRRQHRQNGQGPEDRAVRHAGSAQ